jgi:hypothetical protein
LDDGVTFDCNKGEFLHRKFTYDGGKIYWSKAVPREERVPEFLKEAKVCAIVIYNKNGVRRYEGLNYLVSDEWTWSPSSDVP